MFQTLKRLYDAGRLNETGLQNAVDKGWITQAQFNLIKG
ncbi:XkdX family protein [Chengkuizengella sp. SCS-71B]